MLPKILAVFVLLLVLLLSGCKEESSNYYTPEVMASLEKMAAEKPNEVDVVNDYAWGLLIAPLATQRDHSKALRLSKHAAELSENKSPDVLDTLALAHFYSDADPDEAIKLQETACNLLTSKVPLYLQKPLRTRLAFYKAWRRMLSINKQGMGAAKDEVADAANSFAWILLTEKTDFFVKSPDEKLKIAYDLAQAAVTASGSSNAYMIDTLAIATFKKGDVKEAIRLQEVAISWLDEKAPRNLRYSMACTSELYRLMAEANQRRTWESKQVLKGTSPGDHIPIILVHGDHSDDLAHGKYCRWKPFIDQLAASPSIARDFDVYVWRHNTAEPVGFNGSTGNSKELADYINGTFPNRPVLLVAHSRGGLVCRSYMNYGNQGSNVIGLITLGTPHHGSPGAIPELIGISCAQRSLEDWKNVMGVDLWERLYCKNGDALCLQRPGSMNLAWDNMDGFLSKESHSFDRFSISQSDFNDVDISGMSYYPVVLKSMCGTLAELNRSERNVNKIIAYGAYKTDKDNELSFSSAFNAWCEKQIGGKLGHNEELKDHAALTAAGNVMSRLHEGYPDLQSNFLANDGLVPIQSALFLEISEGKTFAHLGPRGLKIGLNEDIIEKSKRMFAHRIVLDGDHLSFLDSPESYFELIISDIAILRDRFKAEAASREKK